MHQCRSGLLDPVLENTLSKYKRGGAALKVKADWLFWCQNGALLERVDLSFMNSVTGSGL